MGYFRITLIRSGVGMSKKVNGVLQALGLKRRMQTVFLPVRTEIAGQIFAVKELVDVQEVAHKVSNRAMKELRRPDPGFHIESKASKTVQPWEQAPHIDVEKVQT